MNILLSGNDGAMGQTIQKVVADLPDVSIVLGLQQHPDDSASTDYPIVAQLEDISDHDSEAIDVIVDFSSPASVNSLLAYASTNELPLLIATTGHTDQQVSEIVEAAKNIPILYSQNTSIGITVLQETVKKMAKKLYPLGYDIEIIEKHHRYKKDAPSGTALFLKDGIEAGIAASEGAIEGQTPELVFGRSGTGLSRPHEEIGIHAVRAGNIVGEHTVLFANNLETIEVTHRASDKILFAKGAILGAHFLNGRPAGLYTMADVLEA